MPKSSVPRRTLAVFVAAALVGVSATVLLSAAGTSTARAAVAPGATVRASVVDGTNAESRTGAYQQELAAGGNAVVFTSDSRLDNLAPGKGDGHAYENVYVRDLVSDRTVMISRGQLTRPKPPASGHHGKRPKELGTRGTRPDPPVLGEVPPDQASYQPTISADGRFVAFVTAATNIVAGDDDNDQDIIVCDRDPDGDGIFDEDKDGGDRDYRYFRVTEPDYAGESSRRLDDPRRPKLSDDAARIVWLDRGKFGKHHRQRARTATLRPTPATDPGPPPNVDWVDTPLGDGLLEDQSFPDVSGDGRFLVLAAAYRIQTKHRHHHKKVPHTAIMRVDTETGAVARMDLDPAGDPVGTEPGIRLSSPVISRDGSVVAFEAERYFSHSCHGTCWLRGLQPDVYAVHVARDGTVANSDLVSRNNAGEPVNGFAPGLSGDGRFVSFVTDNLNAHDGVDAVGAESCLFGQQKKKKGPAAKERPPQDEARTLRTSCQVVVRDLVVDRERLVAEEPRLPGALASPGTGDDCADPMPADGTCGGNANTTPYGTEKAPTLSSDGRRIAYESDATDLVPDLDDTNRAPDVFVRTFRPELRADPAPLDFGEVLVDTPMTATVRFDHVGIGPLVVTDLEIEGDGFAVLDQTCVNEGILLQQAGSCLVEVEFLPAAVGAFEGVLRLVLADERAFTVDLLGTGSLDPPGGSDSAAFAAGPDPLDFGSRLIRSNGPNATVTVTNAGETPMTVSGVTVEPPAARPHYTVVGNTCATVAPGASCAVTVRFIPTAGGALPAVLSFMDNTPGAPHLVGLAGSAPTPEIEISPAVSRPGRVVTVTGKGFTPNQQVVVSVPLAIQTGPATVAPDGTFRASLLILPKAAVGNKTVVTKATAFPEINAAADLLVVTPTVGPAEFVVRG